MKSKKDLIKKIAALYVQAAKWVTTAPAAAIEHLDDVEEAPAELKPLIDKFAELRKLADDVVQSAAIRDLYAKLEAAYSAMGAREAWNESNKLLSEIEAKGQQLESGLYAGEQAAMFCGNPGNVMDASVAHQVLKDLSKEMPELEGKIKELMEAAKAGVKVVEVFEKKLLDDSERLQKEKEKAEKAKGKTTKVYQPTPSGAPSAPAAPAAASSVSEAWIRIAKDAEAEMNGWLETMNELMGEAAEISAEMGARMAELQESSQPLADLGGAEAPAATEEAPAAAEAPAQAPAAEMEALPASQTPALKAEAKAFPSEHDQSANFLEVVEADGQKTLVIRQDVKSKISRKVAEHFSGAFSMNDTVVVDFGDYMADGCIAGYKGDGIYHIAMADGRKLDVPRANIFGARSAKTLWGE